MTCQFTESEELTWSRGTSSRLPVPLSGQAGRPVAVAGMPAVHPGSVVGKRRTPNLAADIVILSRISRGPVGWIGAVIVLSYLLNLLVRGTASCHLRLTQPAEPDGYFVLAIAEPDPRWLAQIEWPPRQRAVSQNAATQEERQPDEPAATLSKRISSPSTASPWSGTQRPGDARTCWHLHVAAAGRAVCDRRITVCISCSVDQV